MHEVSYIQLCLLNLMPCVVIQNTSWPLTQCVILTDGDDIGGYRPSTARLPVNATSHSTESRQFLDPVSESASCSWFPQRGTFCVPVRYFVI
jgi:hypothetical protein